MKKIKVKKVLAFLRKISLNTLRKTAAILSIFNCPVGFERKQKDLSESEISG